jgi:hypothetical protein
VVKSPLGLRIIASIIIFTAAVTPLSLFNFSSAQDSNNKGDIYNGVSFKGFYTAMGEFKDKSDNNPPPSYLDDSFRLISEAGLNHIRFWAYWEAYEMNPGLFLDELESVANLADKHGLHVLYDNHQWHTSSYLEKKGTGFPSKLFGSFQHLADSGGNTDNEAAITWWADWWNRDVQDENGNDGWTLMAEYLKEIVRTVDKHPSTLGYEILNEPQIHSTDQWEKVGQFNTFMVNELRKVTQKTIAYSQPIPLRLQDERIDVTPENIAKMAPDNKTNTVFKISIYGLPSESNYQKERLSILSDASKLAGVPLYFGEWNKVLREQEGDTMKIDSEESNIFQSDVNQYIDIFRDMDAWGSAYVLWNWRPSSVSNFNLIEINDDDAIKTTEYLSMLKKGAGTQ